MTKQNVYIHVCIWQGKYSSINYPKIPSLVLLIPIESFQEGTDFDVDVLCISVQRGVWPSVCVSAPGLGRSSSGELEPLRCLEQVQGLGRCVQVGRLVTPHDVTLNGTSTGGGVVEFSVVAIIRHSLTHWSYMRSQHNHLFCFVFRGICCIELWSRWFFMIFLLRHKDAGRL